MLSKYWIHLAAVEFGVAVDFIHVAVVVAGILLSQPVRYFQDGGAEIET
jgi:hypothetical protein